MPEVIVFKYAFLYLIFLVMVSLNAEQEIYNISYYGDLYCTHQPFALEGWKALSSQLGKSAADVEILPIEQHLPYYAEMGGALNSTHFGLPFALYTGTDFQAKMSWTHFPVNAQILKVDNPKNEKNFTCYICLQNCFFV